MEYRLDRLVISVLPLEGFVSCVEDCFSQMRDLETGVVLDVEDIYFGSDGRSRVRDGRVFPAMKDVLEVGSVWDRWVSSFQYNVLMVLDWLVQYVDRADRMCHNRRLAASNRRRYLVSVEVGRILAGLREFTLDSFGDSAWDDDVFYEEFMLGVRQLRKYL